MDAVKRESLKILESPAIKFAVTILVIATVSTATYGLPGSVTDLLSIPLFQTAVYFIACYYATHDLFISVSTAFIVAFVFFMMTNFIEGFTAMLQPAADVIPGCADAKLKDLLDLFNGDMKALQSACYKAEVPLNLKLNDQNAPKIGTYLVSYGMSVNENCRAPRN